MLTWFQTSEPCLVQRCFSKTEEVKQKRDCLLFRQSRFLFLKALVESQLFYVGVSDAFPGNFTPFFQ